MSHEAIYRRIYALPKGELVRPGIMLRSKRSRRQRRRPVGERSWDRIVGMVSIDDRPEHVTDRKVPGWGEGHLIVGKGGKPAAATLVDRTTRYTLILGLPRRKKANGLADVLIDHCGACRRSCDRA